MYSPKIRDEHITKLYRLAKSKKVKMTELVDEIILQFLITEVETSRKSINSAE